MSGSAARSRRHTLHTLNLTGPRMTLAATVLLAPLSLQVPPLHALPIGPGCGNASPSGADTDRDRCVLPGTASTEAAAPRGTGPLPLERALLDLRGADGAASPLALAAPPAPDWPPGRPDGTQALTLPAAEGGAVTEPGTALLLGLGLLGLLWMRRGI